MVAIDPLVLSVSTREAFADRFRHLLYLFGEYCRPTVLEPLLSLQFREAYEDRTMRREYRGRQRNNNTKTFPYEPLVMGGRLVMPAELQRVHRAALGGAQITDDMRAVVEKRWPELIAKLPRSG